MVTIKIELNEEYINKNAEMSTCLQKMKESDNPTKVFAQMVAFKSFKDEVDKGRTEFSINRDYPDDEKIEQAFDDAMLEILLLLTLKEKGTKKEESCQSQE